MSANQGALRWSLIFGAIACAALHAQSTVNEPAQVKSGKAAQAIAATDPWAEWVERDFPFFSSVLNAREAGPEFPKDNLVPRGLIFPLAHDCWACFDTDLLRIAAVWRGKGVTPMALAPGSYHDPSRKTP
ncbi:MAG TPA: hypothetical protein PLV87_17130, partial [Opitutaceae bacterium]|nr:hypothetical protein [Opitutaceae bacterium]